MTTPHPARLVLLSALCAAAHAHGAHATDAAPPRNESRPLIVGGKPVADGTYPFVVSLQSARSRHYCTGSLVAPDWVLTAAHCVDDAITSDHVLVGQTSLGAGNGQRIGIVEVHVLPAYDVTSKGDVALVRLATPAKGIEPVQLVDAGDTRFEVRGEPLTVAGWGVLSEHGASPDRLQEVTVPFITHRVCQALYQGRFSIDADLELCASQRGKDACQGDSGGPLFVRDANRQWRQLGVVSWGVGCARGDSPGIYARLASAEIRSFLDGVIAAD